MRRLIGRSWAIVNSPKGRLRTFRTYSNHYTHAYTTDATPAEVLALAEAYLVGLRGFSVPLGHEPTQDSAEFRLRGGLLAGLFIGQPTVKLTAEKRGAKTQLTITANRKQLLEAMGVWVSRELGATAVG